MLKRKIGGACLDVIDEQLMCRIKQLRKLDNIILTHYSSFYYPNYNDDVVDVFVNKLHNFINNQPLTNSIDVDKEY